MSSIQELDALVKAAQSAFHQGEFRQAAEQFKAAGEQYLDTGNEALAAEMANNQSVALLKAGDPVSALQVVKDTDVLFANLGDLKRQGMALGNQAAALEAMGKIKEAELKYEQSAEILGMAGETELRGISLQSLSALKLRHHDQIGALFTMQSALSSKKKLSPTEGILKRLLRLATGLLNR